MEKFVSDVCTRNLYNIDYNVQSMYVLFISFLTLHSGTF